LKNGAGVARAAVCDAGAPDAISLEACVAHIVDDAFAHDNASALTI
jgi:hypothetical protein